MKNTVTAAYVYATGRLRTLAEEERGAGMAEYTLLLALVAVALLVAFGNLATAIETALGDVIAALN